jgi:hypothetical protein
VPAFGLPAGALVPREAPESGVGLKLPGREPPNRNAAELRGAGWPN